MKSNSRPFPRGIHGFPIAPFHSDGSLDTDALGTVIEFLLKHGLQSIFIACGSSEFHAVNEDEYRNMLDTAVSVVRGRVPVYSGVGGNITSALRLTSISEQAGVSGNLIFPPYLVEAEQEGLYCYFKTVAESTDLNSLIYQRGNAIFTLDTVKRLADVEQIIGFKDGYGNMEMNVEFTQTLTDRFEWFNGMPFAEVTMPIYYALGYRSYSSAMSNYLPHISRMFYEALQAGHQDVVSEIYRDVILPINQIRKQRKGYAVSLIKAGMQIVGLPVGKTVRPPLTPVEDDHYALLQAIIHRTLERYPDPLG